MLLEYLKPVECDYDFLVKQLLQLKNDITKMKNAPDFIFSECKFLGKAWIKKGSKMKPRITVLCWLVASHI